MKSHMNLEEHKTMKEKRVKNLNSKDKLKFDENDDMSVLIKKKSKKATKAKSSEFRNNYKNYQYDYEEDYYEPMY